MTKIVFYSNALEQKVVGTLLEERKTTVKIKLDDGAVIVKKKKQILEGV